jgi:hypothetical protein
MRCTAHSIARINEQRAHIAAQRTAPRALPVQRAAHPLRARRTVRGHYHSAELIAKNQA